MVEPCQLCQKDGPIYDHTKVCCHVRLLLKEPRLGVRQAWLALVKRRSPALWQAVTEAFTEAWNTRRRSA